MTRRCWMIGNGSNWLKFYGIGRRCCWSVRKRLKRYRSNLECRSIRKWLKRCRSIGKWLKRCRSVRKWHMRCRSDLGCRKRRSIVFLDWICV